MINQENKNTERTYSETAESMNDYSPFDTPVKQRDYTGHKVENHEPLAPLEEPVFEAPSFDQFEEVEEGNDIGSNSGGAKEPERSFNEPFSELSNKEKTLGAEMMVEMALDMYSKGCGLLGKLPEISESKLDKLIAEGEIHPAITLTTEDGDLPIKQFAVGYNDAMKSAFEVSDEFKENITPPLIRIFKKRGLAMTDEQLVGYYLITDLGTKGVQAVMLRKTTNDILNQLKQNTIAIKEQSSPKAKAEQQTVYAPAPPEPPANQNSKTTQPSKKEEYTEEISEVIIMDRPKSSTKRPKRPLTHLDEQINNFTEPEENGVFANLREVEGFKHDYVAPEGMPRFGDKETLAKMEELAKNPQKPVRKSSKTSAVKEAKKPRNSRK